MSPAVLTETVWALAREQPPLVPDRVVVVTTDRGLVELQHALLEPRPGWAGRTVWQALRGAVLGPTAPQDSRLTLETVRVIARPDPVTGQAKPLGDIVSLADNQAAAEAVLTEVRRLTSSNDTRLLALLAGGRKTMTALLHAAVSLLGREHDRLLHVLVNEPFDDPRLQPRFFFPGQPDPEHRVRLADGNERILRNTEACPVLADVPFVPLRHRFRDLAEIPSSFAAIVRRFSETLRQDAASPAVIELLRDPPRVRVDGIAVELESERQLLVVQFLLHANQKQWLQRDQIEAAELLKAWQGHPPETTRIRSALRPVAQRLYEEHNQQPGPDWIAQASSNDIKRPLSLWRKGLEKAGSPWTPPLRNLQFPAFRIAGDS